MCKLPPAVHVCVLVFTGNVCKHTQVPPAWKCDSEGVRALRLLKGGGHNCRFLRRAWRKQPGWHFALLRVCALVGSARQNISAQLLLVVQALLLHYIVALSLCLHTDSLTALLRVGRGGRPLSKRVSCWMVLIGWCHCNKSASRNVFRLCMRADENPNYLKTEKNDFPRSCFGEVWVDFTP